MYWGIMKEVSISGKLSQESVKFVNEIYESLIKSIHVLPPYYFEITDIIIFLRSYFHTIYYGIS